MNEINDYKRQGLTITQISALTGHSRPTIRKYLAHAKTPRYGPREPRSTLLDPHRSFLEERLRGFVGWVKNLVAHFTGSEQNAIIVNRSAFATGATCTLLANYFNESESTRGSRFFLREKPEPDDNSPAT